MGLAPGSSCCGEQQRLAVAAAVANEPPLLLADEPTSQLDWANVTRVLALLRELRDLTGTTVLRGAPPGARALVEVGDGPVLLHPVDPPDEAPP